MKIPAFIMLFSFSAFLTEMVSFPVQMYENCKKPSSQQSTCTKGSSPAKKTTCCKMKCGMKKTKAVLPKETEKSKKGKCKESPTCTYCPVCSVFTVQLVHEITLSYSLFINKYALVNSDHITAYIPPVWKPPNA